MGKLLEIQREISEAEFKSLSFNDLKNIMASCLAECEEVFNGQCHVKFHAVTKEKNIIVVDVRHSFYRRGMKLMNYSFSQTELEQVSTKFINKKHFDSYLDQYDYLK